MNKTHQMSFFDAPVDSPTHPEAMAQALEQHPDFRVLRRLVPHSDYGPVNGQATRRVIVLDTETTGLDSKSEKVIELAMFSVLVDSATGSPPGPVCGVCMSYTLVLVPPSQGRDVSPRGAGSRNGRSGF